MPAEVSNEMLKKWLTETVAPALEELLEDPTELLAPHTPHGNGAVLQWIATNFIPADPESLLYPDGPSDGGFDIFQEAEVESCVTFTVYQVSAPALHKIQAGALRGAGSKPIDDVGKLHNAIYGKAKKGRGELNPTAREVLFRVRKAIEEVSDPKAEARVRIRVVPVTLTKITERQVERLAELSETAATEWSSESPNVEWTIEDALTPETLFRDDLARKSKGSPIEERLGVRGMVAQDHPQQGPYLCFLKASEVLDLYEKYQAGLFESNLRFFLGKKTEVNKRIKDSLGSPTGIKWFHVRNNGIVITCSSCNVPKPRGKGKATPQFVNLKRPQIINGGQTVVTVGEERKRLVRLGKRRDDEENRILRAIEDDLLLPAKIVAETRPAEIDEIAVASNTQNPLSPRTLRSTATESRWLKKVVAGGTRPWFLETKDGEWDAISGEKKALMQSATGGKSPKDFQWGTKAQVRRLSNADLGVALLAFYGFCEEAKKSRVFKNSYFSRLYGRGIADDGWSDLAEKRLAWRGEGAAEMFAPDPPGAHQALLAYLVWSFWRTWTLTDREQQTLAMDEAAARDEALRQYKKGGKWGPPDEVMEEVKKGSESVYWVERYMKAAYSVLTHQFMRILQARYGGLTDDTCKAILETPQFSELYRGAPASRMTDFRNRSVLEGPLFAMAHIARAAVNLLVQSQFETFKLVLSPQQELLTQRWVTLLSSRVGEVCGKVGRQSFAEAFGMLGPEGGKTVGLKELLPDP